MISQQLWQSSDTGNFYRIVESRGEQKLCNPFGSLSLPFDPNLTGKFNYKKRIQIMENLMPNEKNLVEKPKSLKKN